MDDELIFFCKWKTSSICFENGGQPNFCCKCKTTTNYFVNGTTLSFSNIRQTYIFLQMKDELNLFGMTTILSSVRDEINFMGKWKILGI